MMKLKAVDVFFAAPGYKVALVCFNCSQ